MASRSPGFPSNAVSPRACASACWKSSCSCRHWRRRSARRAQQRQELLIDELNHRVRNILSLIRGIITQSKDPAHTIDSFTEVVGGRIQALARAHDQITADKWGPASFTSMLKAEAGAYLTNGADRVVLQGLDILLEPQAFTTVALVIHEMITNSVKYGALSDRRGRVNVSDRHRAGRGT